jgi:nucleotide-binding universal stress UspA family protein
LVKSGKILLATDMTARCDRALDRATQLADELGAELVIAHVMDSVSTAQFDFDRTRRSWRKIPDPTERMLWRLRRDLAGKYGDIRAIVVEGNPAEQLARTAEHEQCDLIVTGTASSESLGRMLLGSTVNRVLREVTIPILVVHDRPAGPYRNIAVATDFSEASVQALLTAAALFPRSDLTLFHAYDIPYAGFIVERDINHALREMHKEASLHLHADERIAPTLKEKIRIDIEQGTAEELLGDFIEKRSIDLTVIGSEGHGAVFDALVGSTAKRLVESLESDLMIIRHPKGED